MKNIFFISMLLSSCTIPQKYQKTKPFVFKNTIDVKGKEFSPEEKNNLKARLLTQLDDSMKTNVKESFFILNYLQSPPAFDTGYAFKSARNMQGSMLHLGYYRATVMPTNIDTATVKGQKRVSVTYTVTPGPPTLIDTFSYNLKNNDLQQLALKTKNKSFTVQNKPVNKVAVLSEVSRLVDLYRNNGYYKITSDDLRMRGDTTIEALTTISDDPFESFELLAKATANIDKPTIKLKLIQNPAVTDTQRLKKYYINNVYIYPDFNGNDDGKNMKTDTVQGYIITYNRELLKNKYLLRNMFFKKGDLYRQDDYAKTISSFSRLGIWQNVNAINSDSGNLIDVIIQLVPAKKIGFEANLEVSYTANSNTNSVSVANTGNLLGLSGNVSLQNRNLGKQGVKMTHAIRAGVELNLNQKAGSLQRINSNEISYTNTVSIPRLVFPFSGINPKSLNGQQSFISGSIANTNRISLFKLNSIGLSFGYELNIKRNRVITIRPLNVEYSNLYGRTGAFDSTLLRNPYLRYSFNTALVLGGSVGFVQTVTNPKHPRRVHTYRANIEQSGAFLNVIPLGGIKVLEKDLRQFVKLDGEYTGTFSKNKSSLAVRLFAGLGIPVSRTDSSLPFFKQYFAGGPTSMRGWPIRGIGPGSKALAKYDDRLLNDRTGDIRIEANVEYRYDIVQIRPNSIVLRGALFVDAGNIWNYKNTNTTGGTDSLQFKFKNLYKQFGLAAGTGFRLDFNYFLIRLDLGFRFKRPELTENNGWQAPKIGFDDALSKIFQRGDNDEYRKWRYENFNFTIGLSYPF